MTKNATSSSRETLDLGPQNHHKMAWLLYLHFHHCWERESSLPAGLLSHNDSHLITEITSQEEKKMEGHKQGTQHPALSTTCKFPGQNAITFMQYTLTKHMQHSRNTFCVCTHAHTTTHTNTQQLCTRTKECQEKNWSDLWVLAFQYIFIQT